MAEECSTSERPCESVSAWGDQLDSQVSIQSSTEGFDDSFVDRSSSYQPLPDTNQYIKSLETKLQKVRLHNGTCRLPCYPVSRHICPALIYLYT